MQIEWTGPAIVDLVNIRVFIGQHDSRAARDVARRIIESAGRLREFPGSGREEDIKGTREFVIPLLPYILVYRVGPSGVQILCVWHQRENKAGRS